jgi:hypothetical protein
VIAVLRQVGKVAAGAAPAILVAKMGLPALGGLVLLAVIVLGMACWVLRSDDRTGRVSRVLLAWRGNASCLTPGDTVTSAPPTPRPRRLALLRRM